MARTYAQIRDLCEQMLQDPDAAIYTTTNTEYWIEESLKELSQYDPHIAMVTFKIEARTGTATSGTTTNTLEDSTNDHFLATDDANEKVVYNTTDKTWAVITSIAADGDTVTISSDIMVSGEGYKIYNKRCYNNKQIYIGDVGDYLWIDKVEYKCSRWPRSWRNWKLYGGVLEIDIDFTPTDEDEVNVYFAKPHRLFQIATLIGELTADESKGDTRIAIDGLTQAAGTVVEIGDEFHLEGHRTLYTVTADTTLASGCGNIYFFPALEADASDNDDITFVKSTLKPQHEEIFCHLVAARAVLSDNINYINAINKGGPEVYARFRDWGERKLAEVLSKLDRIATLKTKRVWPKD